MNFTKTQSKISNKAKNNQILFANLHNDIILPIIDVEHPAFILTSDELTNVEYKAKKPSIIQKIIFGFISRNSKFTKIISSSKSTFVSGIGTYMLKIGSENLNNKYFNKVDKIIASTLPCLSARMRLQKCSFLIYESIENSLRREKKNLYLINIAGGTAIDSINALMILKRRNPEILKNIKIMIGTMQMNLKRFLIILKKIMVV